MKKIVLLLGIIVSFYLISNNQEDYLLIPNEAIRVRVIANSNLKYDIDVKERVKDNLTDEFNSLLNNVSSIDEARIIIKNNLDDINNIVDKTLKELNYNKEYKINYGFNLFPEKEFDGVKYDSGFYESLVVTLGEGKGPNFWCVLYPPLCMIENDNKEEIEYKLLIKEIINKYIK